MIKIKHLIVVCIVIVCGHAQPFEVRADVPEEYSNLELETLPSIALMIDQVRRAQPYSESRFENAERRHRIAAFIPRLLVSIDWAEHSLDSYESIRLVQNQSVRSGGGQLTERATVEEFERSGQFREREEAFVEQRRTPDPSFRRVENDTYQRVGDDMRWAKDWRTLLTWDLSRLVFHSDESRIVRTKAAQSNFDRSLVRETSTRYTRLRTALINRANQPGHPRWEDAILREAMWLDSMSDGFLSDYLAAKALDAEIEELQAQDEKLNEELQTPKKVAISSADESSGEVPLFVAPLSVVEMAQIDGSTALEEAGRRRDLGQVSPVVEKKSIDSDNHTIVPRH